jgi:23S rRNA G2445 N2-methylase RlmL
MKAVLTTNKGAEEIASIEASELVKAKTLTKEETVVKIEIKELIDLCSLCYKAQAINRALLLFSEFTVDPAIETTLKNLKKSIEKEEFKEWLNKEKSFKVECERQGEHDFHSVDIEVEAGKLICDIVKKKHNYTPKTEFDNPDTRFFVYIYKEKGYFGLDFSGIELSKRQYKIFNHPESLKGTTGYVIARIAGYDMKKSLLDPFMGSGVIPIEAGLYSLNFSVQYYNKEKLFFTNYDFFKKYGKEKFFKEHDSKIKDKKTEVYGYDSQFRFLQASQKNAKLAGVDKKLSLSKCEIEWLDTKFDKKSIDLIVTDPPRMSKTVDLKKLAKLYKEFFYEAEYILKKEGTVTLLTKEYSMLKEAAEKHKFNINKVHVLNQGKEIFNIVEFKRD